MGHDPGLHEAPLCGINWRWRGAGEPAFPGSPTQPRGPGATTGFLTSLCKVSGSEGLPAATRLSAPVSHRRGVVVPAGWYRDGHDGAPSRSWSAARSIRSAGGRRTSGHSRARSSPRPCCGWRSAPSRRLVAGRVSLGRRVRPAQPDLSATCSRSSSASSTAADRAADVTRHGRPQAVRFFLGYGLIFLVQSALTIVIAAAVMIAVDPALAAITLAPAPFVVWIAVRYGARSGRPSRRCSSGSPSSPPRPRRTFRRPRRQGVRAARRASSRASAVASGGCSTRR